VSATPSPSAETNGARRSRIPRWLRRRAPRTFQGRLTIAFVAVIALTLALVTVLVLNRLDDYFTNQQTADLTVRSETVNGFIQSLALNDAGGRPVVGADGELDQAVVIALDDADTRTFIADRLGQADVILRFGLTLSDGHGGLVFRPAPNGIFTMPLLTRPSGGQTQEPTSITTPYAGGTTFARYTLQITLAKPYTFRGTALAALTGLLAAIAAFALGLAILVSAALARRFTTPLRQLTDASRALAEGDLSRRVPAAQLRAGSSELGAVAVQFNVMADRLEESVEIIRRDRDRSRDFLADVSHELRTPLAALRTFNQLLMESAGDDPEARAEFLESSAGQIDRLDWLAQNLLELSKLDSGLVLLELRPDDVRSAVESAVQQNDEVAARRGVTVTMDLPDRPVRIRHDPPRIGQVVANLVANAVKFTPRGGTVHVEVQPTLDGARIDVSDTGVGIEPQELPHIFERFYRGSRANEARGSGSGLGLAIVRSIVDMHGGTVSVESGPGLGSRFSVLLPRDPRTVEGSVAASQAETAATDQADRVAAAVANVTETSPSDASQMNPASAP
jgi:signal transduction histidine kinase